jgi:hypothetical protein
MGFLPSPLGLRIEGHSHGTPSARVLKGSTHPLGLRAEGFDSPSSHSLGGGSSPNLRSSRIPQAYGRPPQPEGSRANYIDRRPQGSLRDVPGCRRPRSRAPEGSRPARGRRGASSAQETARSAVSWRASRPAASHDRRLSRNRASDSALNTQNSTGYEGDVRTGAGESLGRP